MLDISNVYILQIEKKRLGGMSAFIAIRFHLDKALNRKYISQKLHFQLGFPAVEHVFKSGIFDVTMKPPTTNPG